jgi:hypothetical protein
MLHLLGISAQEKGMLGMPLLTDMEAGTDHIIVHRNGSGTDGDHYYLPPEDGITGEGSCYSVQNGKLAKNALCQSIKQKAEMQLIISDRIVIGDLLRYLYNGRTVEAMGKISGSGNSATRSSK